MKPDEFEQQLRNQPLRPLPPAWGPEILAVARSLAHSPSATPVVPAQPWWQEWLWPCPQAWAALAAVWLLLLGLYWMPSETGTANLALRPSPNPEAQMALDAQRRELARLLEGAVEPTPAVKPPAPGRRSDLYSPSKA